MTDTITSETTVETVTFFEDRAAVVRVARVLAARVRRITEPRASASAEQVAELEQQLTRVSGELAGELAARTRAEVAVRRSANLLATWSGVAASVPSRTEEAVRELTDAYAARARALTSRRAWRRRAPSRLATRRSSRSTSRATRRARSRW